MRLYSNEIVFRGHPDKVCDQISDAIVDACLIQDKHSRCGVEVCGGKGKIFITGEITTKAIIDIPSIARRVLKSVGYNAAYEIIVNISKQSPDIALGTNDVIGGAGDNGMMFGYACRDTPQMLPTAMVILQEFSEIYDNLRRTDIRILPDGKAQITGAYRGKRLQYIDTFTICYQNTEVNRAETDEILKAAAIHIAKKYKITIKKFLINPTGRFEIGGFEGDAGLTGRKIVVDSYQSFAPVGGGAFSGKDPSKVDRSGAYMARKLAKEIVKSGCCYDATVQLSYAIGVAEPVAIYIQTSNGEVKVPKSMYKRCTPKNIIDELHLLDTDFEKYEKMARFGHFRK